MNDKTLEKPHIGPAMTREGSRVFWIIWGTLIATPILFGGLPNMIRQSLGF